ncbi:hypothetical protein ACP26L_31875 [Paenibacillus sp. S-38]|uniref:hypothetical protein n=1 Tax=Paenibacillus sp. S-38 TaxID=3416710 RepID=UPI003CF6D913
MKRKIAKSLALTLMGATLLATGAAYADYGKIHIFTGSNTNAPSFQYWVDSSVSTYGYTDHVRNAAVQWSAVSSSNANLWQITDPASAQIKYYVTQKELPSGVGGATDYWMRNGSQVAWTSVRDGSNFNLARVRIDDGNMDAQNVANAVRYKTTGHETGHALCLDEFNLVVGSSAHTGSHWMMQGQIPLQYPTTLDADHLSQKY